MKLKETITAVILEKANLSLEVAILLIAGLTMFITGGLFFPVSAGALPYYENGLYGLLLVIYALQTITLGKTPFGEMHRSKLLLAAGMLIAVTGIVTCIIPGVPGRIPRILLALCLGPGSFLLMLQMLFARDKLRTWMKHGGVLRYLVPGCGSVYILSMLIAPLIWRNSNTAAPVTPVAFLIYGVAIAFLAGVLHQVYRTYPEAEKPGKSDVELSTVHTMLLLMGVFMLLLGLLLIPVNLGLLPFSGSAQLGLLMVFFAVQMLASGNTPIGAFPRSILMIVFGLLFAVPGIVSCIIPNVLVSPLTILIGVINILGGSASLWKILIPRLRKSEESENPALPVLAKLFAAQMALNLLSILFGASMLVTHLIPGLIIGVVLAANGCVLLYLLHLLTMIDRMQSKG